MLTPHQQQALDYIHGRAANPSNSFYASLGKNSPETLALFCGVDRLLLSDARIEVNFHPDRITRDGSTVIDGLLRDGVYRSQFVTGVSSGSRTAFAGGARAQWENEMFGGHYESASPSERPVYGAVNLLNWPDGASVRFGSCYFILRHDVFERSTFCYGDSVEKPADIATRDHLGAVWKGLLADLNQNSSALGLPNLMVQEFASRVMDTYQSSMSQRTSATPGRILDSYVEAHVHGEVQLGRDVSFVVSDPSFRGTKIGDQLDDLSNRYSIDVVYHPGFRLRPSAVPDDFRGEVIPRLAKHLANGRLLTAYDIGAADRSLHENPNAWSDWGTYDETLQYIKQLWHATVQFGE